MKRIVLTLTLAIITACNLFAATVDVETAQKVALNFFKTNAPNASGNSSISTNLVYTKAESDGTVDFYVFDITPVKGFVIVSGNDIMEPVIGYSAESNFHAEVTENIGVSDWMNNTAAKITTATRIGIAADEHITQLWRTYQQPFTIPETRGTTVSPLLTTTWNQEPYYNEYCPFNTADNQRCVTGCVATAMAQIMKFWNYPAHGTGSNSYTDAPPTYSFNYGAQTANFASTNYNWSNMPNAITANNTDVGTLMYQCGVSVNMNYGDDNEGGSGAAVIGGKPSAQYSYVNYFSYNGSTIKGVNQSSYTAAAWVTLLQGELNAGRPIQYMGFISSGGGHTWVCDGYDVNNMFHMNWGWGGYDNGYFSLTNLNPNPYVFNTNDAALIGIQPAGTTSTCSVPANLSTASINTTSATFNWTAVSGAASYKVQYRKVGTTTWTGVTASSATYNATGLTASTNYEWQAETVCSSSSSSAFSSSATFTTTAVPVCSVPSGLAAGSIANTTATLSWASTGAVSYNLQWKLSSASTWTTVSGSTATSYNLTGLTACSSYQFQVQSNCGGSSSAYSAPVSFSTIGCSTSYCSSRGVYTTYEFINKVAIGTISNTSGDNKGYGNFTSLSTNLTGGAVATISLTPGFHGAAYSEYFTVYIDYNHNGLLTDAGEMVASGYGSSTITKTFTVPATALNGATLMRIQMQYGTYETNSCANNYSYGEVEDYTVNITGNAHLTLENPDMNNIAEPFVLYPNPAQDNITLQLNSNNNSNLKLSVYNLLGQKVIYTEAPVTEGSNSLNVNTAALGKGVYIIETDNNGIIQRQKFIIAR